MRPTVVVLGSTAVAIAGPQVEAAIGDLHGAQQMLGKLERPTRSDIGIHVAEVGLDFLFGIAIVVARRVGRI